MKERINLGKRPKCIVDGCKNDAQFMGTYRKDDTAIFRKYCGGCHYRITAEKQGLSVSQWSNKKHPYRKYRKDYCENAKGDKAGWLGYKCTTTIVHEMQLDVDHLDGNPSNNHPDNLLTLCKCCHTMKTNMFADYATKGRKKMRISY